MKGEPFFSSQFLISKRGNRNCDSQFLILRNRHSTRTDRQKDGRSSLLMLRCRLPRPRRRRHHHRRREVEVGARVPHGGRLAPDPRGAAGTGAPQDPEEAGAELASCNARHTHTHKIQLLLYRAGPQRWTPGSVNSRPAARGRQEAGFTQPGVNLIAHLCTAGGSRSDIEVLFISF